eukprot:CAMPEP_0174830812 /NCGR_PEP_ID=MMETSP1114-20130205/2739_1 /TAXON_ID=312471 /ORGANISM="Neobodo designis, Strain CCAP 1951/1" /LENGTH=142 /DNA_ID=CAMNT_0016064621 /DNA_START=28 /DNA_END=453 /DNA_ORIENTATION=-
MPGRLYEVLGLRPEEADIATIRAAFKRKVVQTHPDKLPATATAEQRRQACDAFNELQIAVRTLSDPVARSRYDAAELGRVVNTIGRVSDVVSWSEFDCRDEDGSMTMECRCGGSYAVFGAGPTQDCAVFAECDSCSLLVEIR